jgi:hypothetical protein
MKNQKIGKGRGNDEPARLGRLAQDCSCLKYCLEGFAAFFVTNFCKFIGKWFLEICS